MNEKEKYKEYYSQIKLDDKTSQRIRNAMHSAKRQKNNSLSVHTFNRYASLASCFLVMVFALNSIAGRTYTLPVYHVETTQETSAQETETEIVTSDETTEYHYSTEDGDIITTTVPDDLPSEKITVVPDIDDEDEGIVTDGENDGVTTEPYQESSQTKTGDVTTKRPPVTRPPKNTETAKPTTPTTKPPQSTTTTRTTTTTQTTQATGAVTTATHTHTTINQTEPPVVTTAEGTSISFVTSIETVTSIVEVTTFELTDENPAETAPYETTASETEGWFTETIWVEETTAVEQTEIATETSEQYYIHVLVAVDKSSNIDLSKVIGKDTYTGIGKYSVLGLEIISSDHTNYIVEFILILDDPTKTNTSDAVLRIKRNPIEGQISVYYSN